MNDIIMTPEEFAEKMAELKHEYYDIRDDEEMVHIQMDDLMCDLLRSLGYGDGIDIFNHTPMWYS